jgi:organic radical activating enzyme
MHDLQLPLVEFYITNVCNLSCQGCNRFNNYKFSGFQRWNDYKEIYLQWSTKLKISNITILGGEPLLNPDFMLWFQGLRQFWPRAALKVTTNGYHLNKIKNLYAFVLAHKHNTCIDVGIHNKQHKQMIINNVEKFLQKPLTFEFNNDNIYQEYMMVIDANDVKLRISYNWWFHQGALINEPDSTKFTLHQSDVSKAHAICHSKYCHHFMNGKLYKCGAVALFPEFAQQHEIVLSPEDQDLMMSYRPLAVDDADEYQQEFLNNLPNAIPQCRFCPEEYHGKQIYAEEKKVIFQRKASIT